MVAHLDCKTSIASEGLQKGVAITIEMIHVLLCTDPSSLSSTIGATKKDAPLKKPRHGETYLQGTGSAVIQHH